VPTSAEIYRQTPERRFAHRIKLPRRMKLWAVPAVLALGAVSYRSVVAMAAPATLPAAATPLAATAPAAAAPAESPTAPETAEPNEPALLGGGYADTDNLQADTQQQGIN
jgi:hypothetical protein